MSRLEQGITSSRGASLPTEEEQVRKRMGPVLRSWLIAREGVRQAGLRGNEKLFDEATGLEQEALAHLEGLGVSPKTARIINATKRTVLGIEGGFEKNGETFPSIRTLVVFEAPVIQGIPTVPIYSARHRNTLDV